MEKISLKGLWAVRTDEEENGLALNWAAEKIKKEFELEIPGCIQQVDFLSEKFPPHNDMRNGYLGTYFLEKEFEIAKVGKDGHIRIHFSGIAPTCHIWINGRYAAKNIFGIGHIDIDITDLVIKGKNRVTVAVTEQYSSLISGMRFCGMNWSGIYSEAYIYSAGKVNLSDCYISYKNSKAHVKGFLSGKTGEIVKLTVKIDDRIFKKELTLQRNSEEFSIEIRTDGLKRWSYRSPELVNVTVLAEDENGNLSEDSFKTGLRELEIKGSRITVNGLPTFLKGTGSEYYSPTIAPLTDKGIIERRYKALIDHGFNFYRCHTYIPTDEEMSIADEMGIMLDVEFGLVSNFNKTTPVEKGFEMLEKFIRNSRRHPSVVIYSLGNEGSQLMVESQIERNKAKLGYKIIKENTDNQLAIPCFGLQGELPDIPSDIETPHLWSEDFRISYDGLTDIPWEYLEKTTHSKPAVVHEYGKFGVWPSVKEEKDCKVESGIKSDHGTQAHNWLKQNGLADMEDTLIGNSRKSAISFSKIILEEARRQPFISGYALWTFFRRSGSNAGLSDDCGINYNGNPEIFKNGVNAEIAVLIDRGFQNRALQCNIKQNIRFTLSNFSDKKSSGTLCIKLLCGKEIIFEKCDLVFADIGETKSVSDFEFTVGEEFSDKKLQIKAEFSSDCGIYSNSWDFWAFDVSVDYSKVFLHISDINLFKSLKKIFPNAQRLSSVDSVIIGCRSWKNPTLAKTAEMFSDVPVITDVYDGVIKECVENKLKVIILDSGKLPESWFLPPICPDLGDRDTGRFFTSFRAGWDRGNLVTVVKNDKLLGTFPNDGYCDLQFYDNIQGSKILRPESIASEFKSETENIIESFSKIPVESSEKIIVQDPNAIKEQETSSKVTFNARVQGYLLKVKKNAVVSTLKLTDNPSGISLLKNILKNI